MRITGSSGTMGTGQIQLARILLAWPSLLLFTSLLIAIKAVPVMVEKNAKTEYDPEDDGLFYGRYLREVVEILEKDEKFKKQLQDSDLEHFQKGTLTNQLEFASHHVRTKLDELKRQEVARLRLLIRAQGDAKDGSGVDHRALLRQFEHLNHDKPHTFEIHDLNMLIKTTMKDLENYDKERHNEFKRYEMLKEHERREYLKSLDEETKKLEEERFETMKKKHRDHPKINHPGSKDQLKEVWEEADGLDPNDFSAKTFFKLHDPNNDGFLDENELEALFTRELEKAYNSKNEEDDMIEMEEERLRMREHVMMEIDLNKDRLISWDEFMKYTNQKEFLEDEGWETVDEKPAFSEEELQEFERQLLENEMELKRKAHELHKQKEELVKKHEVHQALKEELNQVKQHIEEKKQQKNTPAPPVKDPSLKLQPPESAQPLSTGHLPDSGISQSLL